MSMTDATFTIQIKKVKRHASESHTRSFAEWPSNRLQTRAELHRAVDQFCDMMRVLPTPEESIEQDSRSDRGSLVQQ